MTKSLLIPLLSLAAPEEDHFLHLLVEAARDSGGDAFQAVAQGPLAFAVDTARRAQAALPPAKPAVSVYLTTVASALSTSSGAALGLALCPHLLRPDFPYRHYIATGVLTLPDQVGQPIAVGDSGALPQKLDAIARLGYQIEPTLLLMPCCLTDAEEKLHYKRLADHNIAVRAVATLDEAYAACRGGARL